MSKAYDRVEWKFITEIMLRIGFAQSWVNSIVNYVSTVFYQVVLNRSIRDIFRPTRGLQQGDPLNPFLFLMCGEGLSSFMRLVSKGGSLKGVKASRSGP
ncbi:hypothetical protein J1N35_026252 [Gossypium stocksii]|uniref:Reverse transcriptase domain-containing protein n=1 Tax=Gossypium stocksii TaxID=47602 RepID=A0A9D3ZYM2_9ROSI|nr:hypothetical protein J1N35_026252 [Gossypium stocksii]